MLLSASTASVASRHSRSTRLLQPVGALCRGPGACRCVAVRKAPSSSSSIARILSRSALVRIGWATSSRLWVPAWRPEQVRPRPDHRDQAHHQLLADRVDRRVGDLGEVLLEVIVEQLRRGSRAPRCGVSVPIEPIGSSPVAPPSARGRTAGPPGCSRTPAGDRAALRDRSAGGRARRPRSVGQLLQLELGRLRATPHRAASARVLLDLLVLDDAALLRCRSAASCPAAGATCGRCCSSGTGSTPTSEAMITWSSSVTMKRAGPQAVAVQRRADLAAVGEGDGRRAVPRLHQRGVVFVESLALGIHQRIAGPGLRDQHHHRMGQRIAAGQQQLERVVEAGGVRLAVRDQRPHLVEVGPEQLAIPSSGGARSSSSRCRGRC